MTQLARRERIAVAMMAALAAGCAPITVERNRRSSVDADEAPALVFFDGGHDASLINLGSVDYQMTVEIEGTVTATEDAIGTVMNALYVQVLQSFPDPTLGGLCINLLEVSLDPHIAAEAESAVPLATFTLRLQVNFETPDGDTTG